MQASWAGTMNPWCPSRVRRTIRTDVVRVLRIRGAQAYEPSSNVGRALGGRDPATRKIGSAVTPI